MSTFFWPRNRQSFYHRSVIPRKLRRYFKGRAQLWRSLKTNDRDDATLKALLWESRVQQVFLTLKRYGARMTPSEIETLIARWMDAELDESEDYRAVHPVTDDYLEGVQMMLSTQFDETDEALSECNYALVATEADALLQAAGIPLLKHDSLDFKRLCRRLLLAKQDVLHIESDRCNGVYKPRTAVPVAPITSPTPALPASKPFSEVVKLYFKENSRAERTDSQIKSELDKFLVTIGGDRPVASITKDDCRTYKEHVLKDRSSTTWNKHQSSLSVWPVQVVRSTRIRPRGIQSGSRSGHQ